MNKKPFKHQVKPVGSTSRALTVVAEEPPSLPADNGKPGRRANGTFAKGNKLGSGNPMHRKAHALRASLFATVSEADLIAVTKKLIAMARKGDIHAIRELLDRTMGKPAASVELTLADARQQIEDMSDDELLEIARAGGSGE